MRDFINIFFFRLLPVMFFIFVLSLIGGILLTVQLITVALMFYLCRYDIVGYYLIYSRGRIDKLKGEGGPDSARVAYRQQNLEFNLIILGITFAAIWYFFTLRDAVFTILSFYIPYAFGFKDILY